VNHLVLVFSSICVLILSVLELEDVVALLSFLYNFLKHIRNISPCSASWRNQLILVCIYWFLWFLLIIWRKHFRTFKDEKLFAFTEAN